LRVDAKSAGFTRYAANQNDKTPKINPTPARKNVFIILAAGLGAARHGGNDLAAHGQRPATFVHYHQRTLPSGRIKIIAYRSVSRVNVVRTKLQRALVTDRSHVLNVRLLVEKIFKNDNLGAIALTGKSAHDIEFPSLNVHDEEIHRLKIGRWVARMVSSVLTLTRCQPAARKVSAIER